MNKNQKSKTTEEMAAEARRQIQMLFQQPMTVDELDQIAAREMEKYQADIDAYDKSRALEASLRDDGKTTSERALEASERPERYPGEHDVAKAWLREYDPGVWLARE